MRVCRDRQLLLHGLLDGELDAANTLRCEAHIRECAGCASEFARLRALSLWLKVPGVSFEAPGTLRTRVASVVTTAAPPITVTWATPSVRRAPKSRVRRRRAVALGWAASVSALAATVVLALLLRFPGASVADELVADHVRSLLAGHLVDIETSDRQVIKPWFTGKVDFSPPIPELAEQGFPLVGGRLDYMPGRVLPAVVYRRGRHIINVFVWPAGGQTAAPVNTRRDGYNVLGWSQGSLRFCAVSDAEPAALSQLKAAIAQQVRD